MIEIISEQKSNKVLEIFNKTSGYLYLPHSIDQFPAPVRLAEMMEHAGFICVQ